MTSDIINAIAAGETVTKAKKGTCKGQKVEMTITRTAPNKKVVDETVKDEPPASYTKLPIDEGKRAVDVLPGLRLWAYSRGYRVLEQSGKTYTGSKTKLRRVLYRDDLIHLANILLEEAETTLTYDEAHGNADAVPF